MSEVELSHHTAAKRERGGLIPVHLTVRDRTYCGDAAGPKRVSRSRFEWGVGWLYRWCKRCWK